MKQNSRVLQLDILRTFAILLVIFHHIPNEFVGTGFVANIFWAFIKGGWFGVDLFFVISGFLVSGLYFREFQKTGNISVANFLIRRGFKIYPGFYFCLTFVIIVNLLLGIKSPRSAYFSEFFFYQSYVDGIIGPTWSLAVEEHFYFLLSLLFLVLSLFYRGGKTNRVFSKVPIIFFVFAIFCIISRIIANIITPEYDFLKHFGNSHLRIDSLMFGVLISYLYYFKRNILDWVGKYKYTALFFGSISLIPYFVFVRWTNNWISIIGLTHIYLAFGLILVSFLYIEIQSNWLSKKFSIIGKNSYAIYLWHVPILDWLMHFSNNFWVVVIYVISAVLAGSIFTYLIEIPFLNLRDKLFPSKSGLLKISEKQ